MALNPFFLQGSPSEQNLIQDLINEQLRMYGVEVHYMPRKYVTENSVIREVIESNFDEAHPIEAYVENFEGYGDQTTILSKFGIQSTQEITLTISKERFESYLTPLMEGKDNIKISNRPKEGDLIYFPLGDRLFEIKFVEHEKPFYQLQKGYVYTLKCELFRYENEVIDTDVAEIDDSIAGTLGASDSELLGGDAMTTLLSVVGVGTTALATVGYVSDGGIRMISVTNRGGGYTYNPDVKIGVAPTGGTSGVATAERISGIVACELNANPVAESIQRVLLTNPGAGYTEAPSVVGKGIGNGAGGCEIQTIIDIDTPAVRMGVSIDAEGVTESTTPTHFAFDYPVYLQDDTEYALVVETDSTDYQLWSSLLGETDISTSTVITTQASLGSLYKSQNTESWQEDNAEDLKFTLYRAEFDISRTANLLLKNDNLGYELLQENPFETNASAATNATSKLFKNNNKIVKANHRDHGFEDSGKSYVFYRTAQETGGVTADILNSTLFQIANSGVDTYNITSTTNASSNAFGGGSVVYGTHNRKFETLYPLVGYLSFLSLIHI